MKKIIIISVFLLLPFVLFAEGGGDYTYSFLNLSNSAHTSALGGKLAAYDDAELSFVYNNPALLSNAMDKNLTLNYTRYFEGINYGYSAYARQYDSINTFSAGIYYVNYGSFIEAEPTGEITGSFRASDYVINLSWSRPLKKGFTLGVNLKPIYSSYYKSYNSLGFAADAGVLYKSADGLFVGSVVIKNAGFQIYSYSGNGQEPLPFEIIAGFSKKLKYAPFRFIISFQDLDQPILTYKNNVIESDKTKATESKDYKGLSLIAENIVLHTIAAVEFAPSKNFYLTTSINFKRRKEMQISDNPGMVGFSFGTGIKVNKYKISYSRTSMHLAGGYNSFSINTNLKEFYKNGK